MTQAPANNSSSSSAVPLPQVAPGSTRIGWIGTGVMGLSMCRHLIRGGYSLQVHTRSPERARELLEAGAAWSASPADLASSSDLLVSMVGFPEDVRQVHLGPQGSLVGARPGMMLVDMTTSSPALAVELARRGEEQGVAVMDAPVSGGDLGARNATLSIMVGGQPEVFEALLPFFRQVGKTVVLQGPAGSGQHTKMVNQILIANNMVGLCEALLYAWKAGLDPMRVLESVTTGAAGSWSLSQLGPRILAGDFQPGFYVDHFVKDMGIALEESARMQLAVPGLALARQLYVALQAQGGGRLGTQALQLALARLSGMDWEHRSR